MNYVVKKLIYDRNAISSKESIIKILPISKNYDFENYFLKTTERKYFLKINRKVSDQCLVINKMYNDIQSSPLTRREIYYADKKIILMEYFETCGADKKNFNQRMLGEKIAKFHLERKPHDGYGYEYDTYIGSLLQQNKICRSWKKFFLSQRYDCLFDKIRESMRIDSELCDKILVTRDYIDHNLNEPNSSTLIHGDIWSGNILICRNRILKIIDPALFYADSEYELAYLYLNGTFGRGFYDSYKSNSQITDDFWQFKLYIYQIIPLMQYALLEGSIYLREMEKILDLLINRGNLKY